MHRLVTAIVVASLFGGCEHTPTKEERAQARGQYTIAVAVVHEAQKAAAGGRFSEQDLKYRQALAELGEAQELDPENEEVRYLLALVYFVGFKRHVDAEQHLREAIRLRAEKEQESYAEAEHLLGTLLVDSKRPQEAIPHLEKARSNLRYPTPYFPEQELGWAHYKLGNSEKAVRHLNNAIAAYPDLCGAYVRLADVHASTGDDDSVVSTLGEFLARCDTENMRKKTGAELLSYGFYRLAMAEVRKGNKDGARAHLEACVSRFKTQRVADECKSAQALLR